MSDFTRRMTVTLFDSDYRKQGQVPKYTSCKVDWDYLMAGAGQLLVPETEALAPLLLTAAEQDVLVHVDVTGMRWVGRVRGVDYLRTGKPGSGSVAATLVSEFVWLQYMLASQNGANPSLVGMPIYDTRTGPIASLAAYYINAASARMTLPVACIVPTDDTTSAYTLNARMTKLSDLLLTPLDAAGVALDVDVWFPDEGQPAGYTLSSPTLVFTPRQGAVNPWLRWSDSSGRINKIEITGQGATGYRAIVGLDGTDAAKVYDSVVDPTWTGGQFSLPEVYLDSSGTTLGNGSQQAGVDELRSHRGQAGSAFETSDRNPWGFGEHYREGDIASFVVQGVEFQQRITRVSLSDDATNGLRFTPTIGDVSITADVNERIGDALARLAQRVATVETRN